MIDLRPGQRIHLVGIGGAGLSAIARVLLERGFRVSGSDLNGNAQTASLSDDGAVIHVGHNGDYVAGADLLLATSAVDASHVELAAARAQKIPIVKRRDFLPALTRGKFTTAIAGAHGKTTTTAMITQILQGAGLDPSFIVGGAMGNTGRNGGSGSGADFVIEADEYDNMFLGLTPSIAVVTNVEHDHPDFFATKAEQAAAFAKFVDLLPATGALVACIDDLVARHLLECRRSRGLPAVSYGKSRDADWQVSQPRFSENESSATIRRQGRTLGELKLRIPGEHNLLNATAALIAADMRGVEFETAAASLREFRNAARRFQIRGERDGIIIVDDYAHHPTEIRVNLRAARERYPEHEIWAIWQPHTYSRVKAFMPDFLRAFDAADRVLITPIYAAREAPVAGVSSPILVECMRAHAGVAYAPSFEWAAEILRSEAKAPTLVLICSAGDANQIADIFLNDNS